MNPPRTYADACALQATLTTLRMPNPDVFAWRVAYDIGAAGCIALADAVDAFAGESRSAQPLRDAAAFKRGRKTAARLARRFGSATVLVGAVAPDADADAMAADGSRLYPGAYAFACLLTALRT